MIVSIHIEILILQAYNNSICDKIRQYILNKKEKAIIL